MSATNLDEVRFFLDDQADLAERVSATGATTTEVMAAIGIHEQHAEAHVVPTTPSRARMLDVCSILAESEDADVEELADEDILWVA
jgi:hypothetical protein